MSTDEKTDVMNSKNIEEEINTVWDIFRHNLRLLRHSECLSAEELSRRVGMIKNRIGDLEGGRMPPNLSDLVKIVDYFPISFDDLLDGKIMLKIINGPGY